MELPTLSGSEKQVAWATDIRDKFLDADRSMHKEQATPRSAVTRQLLVDRAFVLTQAMTNAQWWIETRSQLLSFQFGDELLFTMRELRGEMKRGTDDYTTAEAQRTAAEWGSL